MNSWRISSSFVSSVAMNSVHTVSVIAYPARLTPALDINVAGASIILSPSSVTIFILPLDTTLIWSFRCISPTSATPSGIVISLAYTPPQKYSTAVISTCGCSFITFSRASTLFLPTFCKVVMILTSP